MNTKGMEESLAALRVALPACRPRCALIMGSGWSAAADAFETVAAVPYAAIPRLGRPSTPGHRGELRLVRRGDIEALIFLGRRHWYEGAGWEPVALPVYLALKLGADTLVLTNAAGGMRDDLAPGALMAISDHINLMGSNPLVGNDDPFWGARFPDQSRAYDPALREILFGAARRARVALAQGVYVAVSGPAYETPAEIRAMRAAGGDAVGMSTAPEAMLAGAAGMRVAAIACIANRAAREDAAALTHAEVEQVTAAAMPRMQALLCALLEDIARHGPARSDSD